MYNRKKIKFFRLIKRFEDIFFSFVLLVIFSPILFIVSFLSFLVNGWPIFYISNRMVGINKEIIVIKFRTMVKNATDEKYGLEKNIKFKFYKLNMSF